MTWTVEGFGFTFLYARHATGGDAYDAHKGVETDGAALKMVIGALKRGGAGGRNPMAAGSRS